MHCTSTTYSAVQYSSMNMTGVMIYLYSNRYESIIWVLVQETERGCNVLRFTLDYVGWNPIHDGIVYQVDISCLDRRTQEGKVKINQQFQL